MQTFHGHLTYCTNIHSGESWPDHFAQLKRYVPSVKAQVSPNKPFGIGLRLANLASLELSKEENLSEFKDWLKEQDCYVFTMNGFPYGGFHHVTVKDMVHAPDWTTADRVQYTIRLFRILAALLPEGMEGGISTNPLSYKYWAKTEEEKANVIENATLNMLQVLEQLVRIHRSGGPLMHLDIEPEPDGMLENSKEYIDWYFQYLLATGVPFIAEKFSVSDDEAVKIIKSHIQLCYDVCHFAVMYEDPLVVLERMHFYGLKTGKVQISAALKGMLGKGAQRADVVNNFKIFNEAVYLHQVIGRQTNNKLVHYPDLPEALADAQNPEVEEWRAHFHVPVFRTDFGALTSTREDISRVLARQVGKPFTQHLEIETYTWEVLHPSLKLEMDLSIAREMKWVLQQLES
jgi:hypothetical protein